MGPSMKNPEIAKSSFAMNPEESLGREYPENEHPYRNIYQRDRDRIVHCSAFRRLAHKTQVLVTQSSDHHRTRLTHTLEVAQISRTVARQLGLNEDLTEAIALSHDLGHPPFGHAGETALAECLKGQGGFEHNRHALRIVELLEYPYADYPGLNLTWEVREAMAMHSNTPQAPEIHRFLRHKQPFLEAQVADTCDSLTYNAHDIDDAMCLGILSFDDLMESRIWARSVEKARAKMNPKATPLQIQLGAIRMLIDFHVSDLIETTRINLGKVREMSLVSVRALEYQVVSHSQEMENMKKELSRILKEKVYRHYKVLRMAQKGARMVNRLFQEFTHSPGQLPERYQVRIPSQGLERIACDYLAGMTDRFAQDEFLKMFHPLAEI
ncbi:MAG: deoxyguanosinetriphosphate triphosphohydrolase [Gemmataceae bacterium]|nr:deoxyguanosinetriphosphate triphosphohydrolase [Gemmataceae bacterium]